ncbi:hypothetical protein HK098_001481 [Nowakowskiella sp. JEL0407]|nr:hypothetical protein HK098_001481 [Nowakowskiella sp. JEL0407]
MPDATNFWLGDSKAITSLHKDPYENLYAVIAGRKIFTLIPPTEAFCLDEKTYETAVFDPDKSPLLDDSSTTLWTVKPFNPPLQTPWISLPPLFNIEKDESLPAKFVKNCRPLVVEVLPGDILYLPSMWFHRVEQKEETLELRDGRKIECVMAINYWYDMEFDSRYAYFNFAKGINKLAKETK